MAARLWEPPGCRRNRHGVAHKLLTTGGDIGRALLAIAPVHGDREAEPRVPAWPMVARSGRLTPISPRHGLQVAVGAPTQVGARVNVGGSELTGTCRRVVACRPALSLATRLTWWVPGLPDVVDGVTGNGADRIATQGVAEGRFEVPLIGNRADRAAGREVVGFEVIGLPLISALTLGVPVGG